MSHNICTKDYHKNYIDGLISSLENSLTRARYYRDNNDIRFLNESNEWIIVANLYIKELLYTKELTNNYDGSKDNIIDGEQNYAY